MKSVFCFKDKLVMSYKNSIPPKAKQIPKILEIHGDQRNDPYYWLKEKENPEVLQYLEEENAYAEAVMKDTEEFQQLLFDEMKARYKKDDESLPYFFNGYWYIVRFEEGKEHPLFTRKFESLESKEELLLDVNILADGQTFFEVGSVASIFLFQVRALFRMNKDLFHPMKSWQTGKLFNLELMIWNMPSSIIKMNFTSSLMQTKRPTLKS